MLHKQSKLAIVIVTATLITTVACGKKAEEAPPPPPPEAPAPAPTPAAVEASATLQGAEGSGVTGTVTFSQSGGEVTITAQVNGLTTPGDHGFHIHETGDCSAADFTSAGGHFNPAGHPHGGPGVTESHAGDLGNITIGDDGTGTLELTSTALSVDPGPNSVVGRAVVLHAKADDLESQPTGAAGGRIACGIIAAADAAGDGY